MSTIATGTPTTVESAELRRFVLALRIWALARGRSVEPDAVEAIVGAAGRPLSSPSMWTGSDVEALIWVDVLLWCEATGRARPVALGEALWAYFGFLGEGGLLAEGSETPVVLQQLVCAHCALGVNGRPRSARRQRRPPTEPLGAPAPEPAGRTAGQGASGRAKVHDQIESWAEVLPWRP